MRLEKIQLHSQDVVYVLCQQNLEVLLTQHVLHVIIEKNEVGFFI